MEYCEILSDEPGPLKQYEAATRHAREILIHQAAGDEHVSMNVKPQTVSNHIAETVVLQEFGDDTERMTEEETSAHIGRVCVQALLWSVGIGAVTLLLVLIAISTAGIAQHLP